jgi:hypothetical protein
MLFIGLATFVAFLARPSALTWYIWNGWNVVMIISNYVLLWKRGHIGRRFRDEPPEEMKEAA